MKCKFFRPAVVTASALTVLSFLPAGWLDAQSPTPQSSPAKPKLGHVRFWNVVPPKDGPSFDLVLGAGTEGKSLSTAAPLNFGAAYLNLPPGRYALRVFRSGDRQNALKSFDLPLRDKSYFTFLVTQALGGQPVVEMVDDTPDPAKPPTNRLTVRQCSPDTAVVVTTTGNYKSDSLAYGKTQTIEGLPEGTVGLAMRAMRTGTAVAKTWEVQADFRTAHHATMFVVNDLYGRIRARIAMDGPTAAEEAEAAAEANQKP